MATLYWHGTTTGTIGTIEPLWIGGTTTSSTATTVWYTEWCDVGLAVEDHLDSTPSLLNRWPSEPEHQEHVQLRQATRHVAAEFAAALARREQGERARIEAERARLQQEQERSEAARTRAHALLLSHLTPAQRQTFEANKWFVVEGGRSKTRYRIRSHACAGNIELLDGEQVTHRLCGHCDHTIPLGDQLLAQKLMLELDEDEFLKLANRRAA
jgi:hypothetical protein